MIEKRSSVFITEECLFKTHIKYNYIFIVAFEKTLFSYM